MYENRTYYELLGVERNASIDEIKEAYREIARVYHPDSNFYSEIVEYDISGNQMHLFQAITAAYNTLTNLDKRKAYDSSLAPELRGWDGKVPTDDSAAGDAEVKEYLDKIGVKPEAIGIKLKPQAKPKPEPRQRKSSAAFGVFGTIPDEPKPSVSTGNRNKKVTGQFNATAFRHAEDESDLEKKVKKMTSSFKRPALTPERGNLTPVLIYGAVGLGSFIIGAGIVAFFLFVD